MPLAKAEASVSGVAAAHTEGLAESLGARILAVLLLVSPFFFWGTSMVGMKVRRGTEISQPTQWRSPSACAALQNHTCLPRLAQLSKIICVCPSMCHGPVVRTGHSLVLPKCAI